MHAAQFNEILEAQIKTCVDMLGSKAEEYADDVDRLANFKKAAALKGITVREALSGMMVKHTVSVYDLCANPKDTPEAVWIEKITDHINYLILLRAVIIEEQELKDNRVALPVFT